MRTLCFSLFSVLILARADEAEELKWTSPQSGEIFEPGQMITASWQSDQAIISPSFSLCVEVDGGDDCGDAIWPAVSRNGSSDTYSMSIIAPSISSQGSFFIKMKSDLGDYYTSPDFDLSPIDSVSSLSSLLPFSTSSFPASSTSPIPEPTTPPEASGPNPLAIGIPLTMVGMALLGAVVFCLTRSKREKREAGGRTTGLNPSIQGSSSVFHAPLAAAAAKGGVLEAGGATFFNVSLSKTTTDLSNVEKAVCGAISAGSAAARPVPVRQEECRSSSTVGSKLPALDEERLTLVGEDERYTTPPPRTWQRRESDRYGRDRTWAMEKQLRRALEREADLHWELERRKLAWRKMNSSFPSHSRRMFEENDRRCFSMHSAPDLGPDRWASTSRSRPYALRQSSPEHVAGDLPSIDPPNYRSRDPSEELLSRAPGPRPPTAAASSKSGSYPSQVPPREDDDMHTSLSVVSAYCAPSPLIPRNDSSRAPESGTLPSSTSMFELPSSLRAGGRTGPSTMSHPMWFARGPRSQRHDSQYTPGSHPRFDFEQRDASQFRFSNMGMSEGPSKSYSSHHHPYGRYVPRDY